jgi:hypothetical protein
VTVASSSEARGAEDFGRDRERDTLHLRAPLLLDALAEVLLGLGRQRVHDPQRVGDGRAREGDGVEGLDRALGDVADDPGRLADDARAGQGVFAVRERVAGGEGELHRVRGVALERADDGRRGHEAVAALGQDDALGEVVEPAGRAAQRQRPEGAAHVLGPGDVAQRPFEVRGAAPDVDRAGVRELRGVRDEDGGRAGGRRGLALVHAGRDLGEAGVPEGDGRAREGRGRCSIRLVQAEALQGLAVRVVHVARRERLEDVLARAGLGLGDCLHGLGNGAADLDALQAGLGQQHVDAVTEDLLVRPGGRDVCHGGREARAPELARAQARDCYWRSTSTAMGTVCWVPEMPTWRTIRVRGAVHEDGGALDPGVGRVLKEGFARGVEEVLGRHVGGGGARLDARTERLVALVRALRRVEDDAALLDDVRQAVGPAAVAVRRDHEVAGRREQPVDAAHGQEVVVVVHAGHILRARVVRRGLIGRDVEQHLAVDRVLQEGVQRGSAGQREGIHRIAVEDDAEQPVEDLVDAHDAALLPGRRRRFQPHDLPEVEVARVAHDHGVVVGIHEQRQGESVLVHVGLAQAVDGRDLHPAVRVAQVDGRHVLQAVAVEERNGELRARDLELHPDRAARPAMTSTGVTTGVVRSARAAILLNRMADFVQGVEDLEVRLGRLPARGLRGRLAVH